MKNLPAILELITVVVCVLVIVSAAGCAVAPDRTPDRTSSTLACPRDGSYWLLGCAP